MTLTDEEIRIKVAEAMGYHTLVKLETPACHGWFAIPPGKVLSDLIRVPLPNYPEDLNACAEFEKTLTEDELEAYREHISELLNDTARIGLGFTAKPKIRCIAYLKTKGILP